MMKPSALKLTLIILALLAALIFLNWQGWLESPKNIFFKIISMPSQTLREVGQKISPPFYYLINSSQVYQEKEKLLAERNELLSEAVTLKEVRRENEILKQALAVSREEKFELVPAKIIGLNFFNFDNIILIDRGQKDGLTENLPIIIQNKILVGKIIEVYQDSSKIIAISDPSFSLAGMLELSRAQGVVRGTNSPDEYLMDTIAKEDRVEIDDLVITSGFDGIFPKGLLVGKIKRVDTKDIELFQRAYIEPLVSFRNLEEVFVIVKSAE